jgi:hypothetical protein
MNKNKVEYDCCCTQGSTELALKQVGFQGLCKSLMIPQSASVLARARPEASPSLVTQGSSQVSSQLSSQVGSQAMASSDGVRTVSAVSAGDRQVSRRLRALPMEWAALTAERLRGEKDEASLYVLRSDTSSVVRQCTLQVFFLLLLKLRTNSGAITSSFPKI